MRMAEKKEAVQTAQKDAKKSKLAVDNDFTPVEYDPQYILIETKTVGDNPPKVLRVAF